MQAKLSAANSALLGSLDWPGSMALRLGLSQPMHQQQPTSADRRPLLRAAGLTHARYKKARTTLKVPLTKEACDIATPVGDVGCCGADCSVVRLVPATTCAQKTNQKEHSKTQRFPKKA